MDKVHAVANGTAEIGKIRLTDYHIVFTESPKSSSNNTTNSTTTESTSHEKPRTREIWIAYPMISNCEFHPTPPATGQQPNIRLRGRDYYFVNFIFPDNKSAQDAFNFIRNHTCRLGSIEKLYAFSYLPPKPERTIKGWAIYDVKKEFQRQGISEKSPDKGWRISTLNKDYTFSPTYPSVLVVPTKISDNTIKHAGSHRSRARIPALTYLHPINNCSITRSSQPMVGIGRNRSIQDERLVGACFSALNANETSPTASADPSPPVSQQDTSSDQDLSITERLEDDLIAASDAFYDDKGKRIVFGAQQHNLIIDARPAINSMAMQVIGKGSEIMEYYKFAKKAYLNIQNIHVMRDSLNKVIDALKHVDISEAPPNQDLLARSGWLKHISGVLDGSALIARQVGIQHSHVLIHCSDGWDRTSQLSALSQLMLDPYYRTLEGFAVLVEKDWLAFGHMFQRRSGFLSHEKCFTVQNDAMAGVKIEPGDNDGRAEVIDNAVAGAKRFFRQTLNADKDNEDSDPDNLIAADESTPVPSDQKTEPKEISPIFHQFLDAVYQMLRQYPSRFEFNDRFLRRLLYHLYSCQYGTFLYNSEKQRRDVKVQEKTSSVWDHFLSRREIYLNPDYDPEVNDHIRGKERLIFPRLDEVRWWFGVFGRRTDDMNGALEAAAAAAKAARDYQVESSTPGTPRAPRSPSPPGHTVVAAIEGPHSVLTPGLMKTSSAGENPGALASLTKSLETINFSPFAKSASHPSHAGAVPAGGSDQVQEMQEMQ